MRKLLLGAAIVMAVSTLAVPAASAAPAASAVSKPAAGPSASLRGWAGLSPQSTALPGFGNLTLTVDAHAGHRPGSSGPDTSDASGHATIQHEFFNPDGSWQGTIRIEVNVDCLTTGGPTATVTGTVESLTYAVPPGTTKPAQPSNTWHPETGFSFYLGRSGQSRVGWSGVPDFNDPTAPPKTAKCMAPATDFYVVKGGYKLKQ